MCLNLLGDLGDMMLKLTDDRLEGLLHSLIHTGFKPIVLLSDGFFKGLQMPGQGL